MTPDNSPRETDLTEYIDNAQTEVLVKEIRTKLEFLSTVLKATTGIDFSGEEALRHWELVLKHQSDLMRQLDRAVSVPLALVDYFTFVYPVSKNAMVVDAELFEKLQKHASKDFLTDLYNLPYFLEALDREIARVSRSKAQFSLILFDIEDFKFLNDAHGRQKGDEVLVSVSSLIKSVSRGQDILCRSGGDEFLSLLPDTNFLQALAVAERIRKNVTNLPNEMGLQAALHLNYGIATHPADGKNFEELFKVCEARFRAGKRERLDLNRKSIVEKRSYPRFKISRGHGVLHKNAHHKYDVELLDISPGGLSFVIEEPPDIGSVYHLQLFLAAPFRTARADVEAVHLQNLEPRQFRAGCKLKEISFL